MHAASIRVLRFCDPVFIIVSLVSVPCNRSHVCCITTQEKIMKLRLSSIIITSARREGTSLG